jgi:hypothetical protein
MRTRIAVLFVALVAICGRPAFARQDAEAPQKVEFRKWDLNGSLGILGTSARDFGGPILSGFERYLFAWNVDAGRYFTPHVKGEVGLMRTNELRFGEALPASSRSYSYREHRVHPTSLSAALTYQFFENVFAHPYVSAGVRVTAVSDETQTFVYSPTYSATSVSTTSRVSEVRPFVAVGYKSYFNERAYMKTDALLAIDTKGISHGTLRAGFGIDF